MTTPANHTKTFVTVFLLLCGLTALSFWVANSALMDHPVTGWCVMIAISLAKASLVLMFFMHLWWERSWKYVLTFPAITLACVLVLLLIPDIGWRTETYSQERQTHAPAAGVDNHESTNQSEN